VNAQLDGSDGERFHGEDAYLEFLDRSVVSDSRDNRTEDAARFVFAILLLESWLTTFRSRAATPRTVV
jgi:hypothetical protein